MENHPIHRADGKMEIGESSNNFIADVKLKVFGGVVIGNPNDGINVNSSLLKVYGMISARKLVITQTNFADYVFDNKYNLLSIKQVDEFIKINKHLPGMPSEAEIKKNGGFCLDEIQLKNLEKTEELFLYIIQLKSEIDELKKQMAEMKNN